MIKFADRAIFFKKLKNRDEEGGSISHKSNLSYGIVFSEKDGVFLKYKYINIKDWGLFVLFI